MLEVVLPERCALAEVEDRCSLYLDHYRDRKTGPCFPVAVVGCTVHAGPCYTLYPPGHIPYGREAAVPCSPLGPLLRSDATGQSVWETTLFGAAVDAAVGVLWPPAGSESLGKDGPPACASRADRRRRTQGRRLVWASQLLGIHPEGDPDTRERIASRLGVPTMTLRDAAQRWRSSWTSRGEAVLSVLRTLPADGGLLDRMLAAGEAAGLWPPPCRWDRARRAWVPVRIRSRPAEHPVAGGGGYGPPSPTTSRGARSPSFL